MVKAIEDIVLKVVFATNIASALCQTDYAKRGLQEEFSPSMPEAGREPVAKTEA